MDTPQPPFLHIAGDSAPMAEQVIEVRSRGADRDADRRWRQPRIVEPGLDMPPCAVDHRLVDQAPRLFDPPHSWCEAGADQRDRRVADRAGPRFAPARDLAGQSSTEE